MSWQKVKHSRRFCDNKEPGRFPVFIFIAHRQAARASNARIHIFLKLSRKLCYMWFEVSVAFFMSVSMYFFLASFIGFVKEKNDDAHYRKQITRALPNYLVYKGSKLSFTDLELNAILNKYFPYYYALSVPLKQKFLDRLKKFIKQKTYIIRHHEGFREMPVLISAAAIQITFGLDRYLLPYFTYIQIHPEEYFADNALRVLAGHVNKNTITLAWNHFLKGFKEEDGSNVGLHEMAHALYYQHLIADVYQQKSLVTKFEGVMTTVEETCKECRELTNRLYSDYAFTNMQEFWAESLEIFFEKTIEMERLYPALAKELCTLLKQNPKNKSEPLSTPPPFDVL